MTKQFTFDTESAVRVLNYLASEINEYEKHGESLFSETLKHRNAGRIEAYTSIHDYLLGMFQINGLEILELEAENVEEETQTHVDVYGILGRAFSHFSK